MFSRGVFIEPTSAAVVAGVKKYAQMSVGTERIVSAFTGHGLKAADKILKLKK
jgi:threonine synthase